MAKVVALLVLLLGVAPATADAAASCAHARGRVLARTASVRVLLQPERQGYREVIACGRGSAAALALGPTNDDDGSTNQIRHLTLAGRFVAFERSFTDGRYHFDDTVALYDVRAQRRVFEGPSGVLEHEAHIGDLGLGAVTDLVLRADGHLAWMAYALGDDGARMAQVWKRDTGGLAQIGDSPALVPGSLTLTGPTVSWRDGAAVASAPFA